MIIRVTKRDIKNGVRRCCERCPIARAIERRFHGYTVSVGYTQVCLSDGANHKRASIPEKACQFVLDFDLGQPVQPFSFELEFAPC